MNISATLQMSNLIHQSEHYLNHQIFPVIFSILTRFVIRSLHADHFHNYMSDFVTL